MGYIYIYICIYIYIYVYIYVYIYICIYICMNVVGKPSVTLFIPCQSKKHYSNGLSFLLYSPWQAEQESSQSHHFV